MAPANCRPMASASLAFSAIVATVPSMTVSLSAHFDGKSIVLDEDYPLRPQAKLLVTVIEDERTIDAQTERSAWSARGKQAFARVFGSDEPDYSVADAIP